MMTLTIRTVKKEIRILGLDFCNNNRIIGAVTRGGDLLDGIISFPTLARPDSRRIAQQIRQTRYYPELRAVMIHDPGHRSKPEVIERTSRLPVIRVLAKKPGHRRYRIILVKRGLLWVQTGLSDETLRKVLSLTWTWGRLPEPARAAHLLALTRVSVRPFLNCSIPQHLSVCLGL